MAAAPMAFAALPAGAVTRVAVPGPPTGVTATSHANASSVVSWTAPSSAGGAPISSYSVRYSSNGGWSWTAVTSIGVGTTKTVTGLKNGTSYVFDVAAINSGGTGAYSTSSASVTPATVPGAPTKVKAVSAQNAMSSVSWTAPTSNGGSAITGYTVTSSPGSKTCTSSTTSCTVTGLTNGTSYTFTVAASNALGASSPSTPSAAAVPSTTPGAPTSVTATSFQNGKVPVTWSPPTSLGGSAIKTYVVRYSSNGGTSWTTASTTVRGTVTSYTVTGLANGTNYLIGVAATTSAGTGSFGLSALATPSTTPSAPTAVSATMVNYGATVSWTVPASNGGTAVTGYVVRAIATGSGVSRGFAFTTAATSQTVTGLVDGTTYTFTVQAVNNSGPGLVSAPSNSVVPAGPPGAPADVTVSSDWSGTVAGTTISWLTPDIAGSAITGYTVAATDHTNAANSTSCISGGSRLANSWRSCTVTGLVAGDDYSYSVTATNGIGSTTASTPGNVDGASASLSSTGNVAVSWTAPAAGSTPTSYQVQASSNTVSSGSVVAPATFASLPGTPRSVAFDTAGNAYVLSASSNAVYKVTPTGTVTTLGFSGLATPMAVAVDSSGDVFVADTLNNRVVELSAAGAQSTLVSMSMPSGLAIAGGTIYVSSWTARQISSYSVTTGAFIHNIGPVGGLAGANQIALDPSNNLIVADTGDHRLVKLTTSGILTVVASGLPNPVGVAVDSSGNAYVVDMTTQNLTEVEPSGTEVAMNAAAPLSGAVAVDASNNVYVGTTNNQLVDSSQAASCTEPAGTTTCTLSVPGLTSLNGFSLRIQAVDANGNVGPSVFVYGTPSAPGEPTIVTGDSQATASWSTITGQGVTSYQVTASDVTNPGMDGDGNTCTAPQGTSPSCTITGLTNGDSYTFGVTATNTVGTSPASTSSAPATPSTVPDAPTGLSAVDNGDGTSTVSWTASDDEGSPITGYTVTATDVTHPGIDGDGNTCMTDGSGTSCTVTGLTEGDAYTFSVVATNANGDSAGASVGY